MAVKIQLRRGISSEWTSANPILLIGEIGLETNTKKFKIGDGSTNWNSLTYATQGEVGMRWLGAYSGVTSYIVGDLVSYNNSSYICKSASTGNLPTNTTYWDLVALSGTAITVNNVSQSGGNISLTQDNIPSGTTNKVYTVTEQTKLAGVEVGAEVNNISDVNATDLTDGGITTLHKHNASDISVSDPSNYFAATNVEDALAETANIVSTNITDIDYIKAYMSYIDIYNNALIPDVYGVEVDFVNKTFTRLAGAVGKTAGANFNGIGAFNRRRCNLADNGTVNAYYGDAGYIEDGSNGQVMVEQNRFYYKVVPLQLEKIADYAEVNTFKVTAPCTTNGNVTITLNGVAFTVAVTTEMNTVALVASAIRGATYTGWVATGATDSVIFTRQATGVATTGTFVGTGTGVTATVAKTIAGGVSKGYHMRKARYYVSDFPKAGFKVHPAFVRNGVEKSKIYLPAYEGSIYDVSATAYLKADEQIADFTVTTGDKLSSIAYAKPASGLTQDLTRAKTRILATNRGIGWQQKDVLCASASQMLMMIEYAAMNMQTAIGKGVCDKPYVTGQNDAVLTGSTTTLGNASGMATGTNGLVSITYRGEENFWGNIWKWIDGLNIEIGGGVHGAWYADNSFADNIKTAPYKNAGFTLAKQNGYVSAIGWSETCDFLFLATATVGDSSLPVGDYFFQAHFNTGWMVARLGGDWADGLRGGAFYWYALYSSTYRDVYIGGGAVYVPAV